MPSEAPTKTNPLNRTVLTLNEKSSRFDETELRELRNLENELHAVKDEPLKEPESGSNSMHDVKTMASGRNTEEPKQLLNTNSSMILNLEADGQAVLS